MEFTEQGSVRFLFLTGRGTGRPKQKEEVLFWTHCPVILGILEARGLGGWVVEAGCALFSLLHALVGP